MIKPNTKRGCLRASLSLALCVLAAGVPHAACQTVQFRVVTYLDQWGPAISSLVEVTPGTFYFIAGSDPQSIVSITPQGTKNALTTLASVQLPSAMVSGANGRYYSALQPEGIRTGNIFSVSSMPGKEVYPAQTILPLLIQNLPNGDMLGIGANTSATIWYVTTTNPAGAVTPLYQFPDPERESTAIYATDGNYYGVSTLHDGSGYLYQLTPSGSLTKMLSFPANSLLGLPTPLLQADDGNLYGTTPSGGASANGTIYKLTLSGDYTLLYTFPDDIHAAPEELLEAGDGNLYGLRVGSYGLGGRSQVFRITKSGEYTTLITLPPGLCGCVLTLGSDGLFYGTTVASGPDETGGLFTLDVGLPKPPPWAATFTPLAGSAGTQVLIWGRNLFSSSVQFNGVEATAVSSSGSNYLWATVPAGATTGPITITTPAGTMTTRDSFTVR